MASASSASTNGLVGRRAGLARTALSLGSRWRDSEATLVERIRDEILATPSRRITFARFMQRALTEPGLGYYASSQLRPTRDGDFLTAPELHPFFGHCVARFVTAAWRRAGEPDAYLVREYGAGRGTLRDNVERALRADASGLAETIQWQALDLPGRGDAPDARSPDLVVANEYLDALPVHRVVEQAGLKEIYVGWREDWFCELIDEPSDAGLARRLQDSDIQLAPGQQTEICLAATQWMRAVASEAKVVLVIDYGHPAAELYGPRRMAGSLLTYRDHAVADDPFMAVGRTDITTHVDITALQRAGAETGLALIGVTTQAHFLVELGLGEMLSELGQDGATTASDYIAARAAVGRLIDPRHLGGFHVLAWAAPDASRADQPLPGFGSSS
jgi:SAM-dependent MidA family methyltransferase